MVLTSTGGSALADSYDEQINALRAQVAAQQAQAGNLHAQANDAAARLAQLRAQSNALQAQINLNQAKYNQISANIALNETKLAQQKAALSASLKSMYLKSSVTPIEMLVSSKNLSDFFDQQQYRDKIKSKIQSAMAEVQTLQAQLAAQQIQVNNILEDQKGQQQQLYALVAEANQLAALAAQNAAAADNQVRNGNSQIATLKAQQAAAIAAASRHVSGGSGCGGYPALWCNSEQDSIADSWGMWNRECVSYAAWAASERFGHNVPYWGGRGNAKQWPGNADAAGIPRDGNPRIGDVAIYMGGTYGHAMIVEEIRGSVVRVSSFNGDNTGHYSVDDWPISSLTFIHFR